LTYLENAPLAELLNEGVTDPLKRQHLFGIFGEAPIGKIISIPTQVPFDPLHLLFQGHGKWLLNKIFIDKKASDNFIGLYNK